MTEESIEEVKNGGVADDGNASVFNGDGYSESDWDDAVAALGDIEGTEKKRITPDKEVKNSETVNDVAPAAMGAKNSGESEKSSTEEKEQGADSATEDDTEGDNSSFISELLNGTVDDTDSEDKKTDDVSESKDQKVKETAVAESKPFVPENLDEFVAEILKVGKEVDKDIKEQIDSFPDDMNMMAKIVGIALQKFNPGKEKSDESKAELDKRLAEFEERMKVLEGREQSIKAKEEQLARDAWDNEVEKSVPGWRDMINKDKRFPDWFKRQGGWIKDALTKPNEPNVVIEAMQKFINDVGVANKRMKTEQDIYSGSDNRSSSKQSVADTAQTEQDMWEEAVKSAKNSRTLY